MDTTSPDASLVWITAQEAYRLVLEHNGGDPAVAIATRANAEIVRSKAALFTAEHAGGYNGKLVSKKRDSILPPKFWWAHGYAALEQDWAAGDFSTWIDQTYQWAAFGVQFVEHDIRAMLCAPQHPADPEPVPAGDPDASNQRQNVRRTRGRRLAHDHPYAAASVALELARISLPERGRLTGPSIGKDMEKHYTSSRNAIPHTDNLDDYGESVLKALLEFWSRKAD